MNTSKLADTAEVQTTTLSIGGMSCGACARHLTSALEGLTGVVHVEVDLKRNQANVEHLPDRTDENTLIAAIEGAGYTARVEATRDEEFGVSDRRRPDAPPVAAVGKRRGRLDDPAVPGGMIH